MSRKPIWYLSDRQSYCEYCCTATVHEIEDVVEHQLTYGICLPYICPSLLSRHPLRSDRRGLFHHKTFTARSGRNLSTEKSSLTLHSGCGWAQPSFCVRPVRQVSPFVPVFVSPRKAGLVIKMRLACPVSFASS